MCWVIPPASPATTLAWRIASRSDVLPWSTWPMIVTIGGRGTGAPSSSGRSNSPSSTSELATRLTVWPISSAISSAVSASSTSVSVTMRPWRIRSLITSTARSDMRAASSWMVIASGSTISRAIFSFWSCIPPPLRRWVRRRNEATERVRSSSAEVAVATVRRPRLRCSAPRDGRGVGSMTFCGSIGPRAGRLTTRGASSTPALGATGAAASDGDGSRRGRLGLRLWRPARRGGRGRRRGRLAGQTPARLFLGLALEIRVLGATGLLLALACFSGIAFGAFAGLALAARVGFRLLAAAVFLLAGARVEQRLGSRFPLLGGERRQDDAGLRRRRAWARWRAFARGERYRRLRRRSGAGGDRRSLARPSARRLTFSTTTALVRPCEKLWRTVPCSTGRFRCKVAFGGAAPLGLSLLLVSFMPIPNRLAFQPNRLFARTSPDPRPGSRRRRSSRSRPSRSRENSAAARPAPGRPMSLRQI